MFLNLSSGKVVQVMSSSLCKKLEGGFFHCGLNRFKMENTIRSTLCTLTKQTMGRVRRRTSTKQRSMTLVVRSFFQRCLGNWKKLSSSGRSRCSWRTMAGYASRQRAWNFWKAPLRPAQARGAIDGLGVGLDRVVVALPHLLQDVAHLVDPAALVGDSRIDGLQGGGQASTTVGDDQLQVLAFQPAPVEVPQESFPGRLALARAALKPEQAALPVAAHPVGHQHLSPLATGGPPHAQAHPIQE